MSLGTVAVNAPDRLRPQRQEKGLLVVGDERVRCLAERHRTSSRIVALHDAHTTAVPEGWDELVVEAPLLKSLQHHNPGVLRAARRVWVVPGADGSDIGGDPFSHPLPLAGRVLKRSLDFVLALVGLLLALPVLLVAMVAVRRDSPGPAIFRQERVGRNGKRFQLYKIRTMHEGRSDARHRAYQTEVILGTADPRCGVFKLADDARITPVGRLLRQFSIDELPQLWNVLQGDMSMVGPRPALPWEVELYSMEAWQRLRVEPGLTGLWQVSGRSLSTFDEMVALDIRYWQRWSVVSDLALLLKTPAAVLRRTGAV